MADYRYLKISLIQVDVKTLPKFLPDPGSWSRADPGTAPAFSQLLRKWTQLLNEKICTGTVVPVLVLTRVADSDPVGSAHHFSDMKRHEKRAK